jgi:formylglycine-generating enzyme required for sulfatase activity
MKDTITLKSLLIILILVLFTNYAYSQSNKSFYGMIKCSNGYWVDQSPITVDSWISYYNWIRINIGEDSAKKALPDSNMVPHYIWEYIKLAKENISKGFVTNISLQTGQPTPSNIDCSSLTSLDEFYKGKKVKRCPYGYYPITGITYKQVMEFCNWRSEKVGGNEIIFKLPSNKEWKEIATEGMKETDREKGIIDSTCNKKSTCASFNYRLNDKSEDYLSWGKNGMSLKPIDMFSPNQMGVYDLFGNVSEMTEEQGVAKGGNFQLFAVQCHIDSIQVYSGPELWLGFRCIAKTK